MGMRLACRRYGQGDPVLLLHGLFGSAAQWHHIALPLAQGRRVLAVDLRNHGASPHAPCMDYISMAQDLRELLDAQGLARAALVGHSMGGKLAMAFALLHPQRCQSVAVLDIAPARYADGLTPLIYAALRVDLAAVRRREDADAQLARHLPSARLRAMLLQNLVRRDRGWAWRIHWAGIAASMPALLDFPSAPGRRKSAVPTLFLRGAASDYLTPRHEPLARAMFSETRFAELAGAGHWLHADRPGALVQALDGWLRRGVRPLLAESPCP